MSNILTILELVIATECHQKSNLTYWMQFLFQLLDSGQISDNGHAVVLRVDLMVFNRDKGIAQSLTQNTKMHNTGIVKEILLRRGLVISIYLAQVQGLVMLSNIFLEYY